MAKTSFFYNTLKKVDLMTQSIKETLNDISSLSDSKSFLGKEFLTWLWYFIDEEGGSFTFSNRDGKPIEADIWVDDKIAFESTGSDSAKHSLNGGNPSSSLEATAALLTGKIVSDLKLGLKVNEDEFSFGLSWKDLSPKSVGLPKILNSSDPATAAVCRLDKLDLLFSALDGIFTQFVDMRINDSWEDESLENLRSWISQRKFENLQVH